MTGPHINADRLERAIKAPETGADLAARLAWCAEWQKEMEMERMAGFPDSVRLRAIAAFLRSGNMDPAEAILLADNITDIAASVARMERALDEQVRDGMAEARSKIARGAGT